MYKEHPVFVQPPNEEIKVWRYMNFAKLVSLLESRCLFFSRADKQGDPFEGSYPKINVSARLIVPEEIPEPSRSSFLESMKNLGKFTKEWRRHVAVNCWHMNEHESAAMWKTYLTSAEGIAIQSTYKRLKVSLIDKEPIFLGMVNYIDYQTEGIDPRNVLSAFMHKRKSYEHEREVRALIIRFPIADDALDLSKETITDGIRIMVSMENLIERIFVAPASPVWIEELVKSVVAKYGYTFEIKHSGLDEPPLF
jgi:hypothetical protein